MDYWIALLYFSPFPHPFAAYLQLIQQVPAFISGASMNPARSLAPVVLSGVMTKFMLYWTATFIGTLIVALFLRKEIYASIEKKRLDTELLLRS